MGKPPAGGKIAYAGTKAYGERVRGRKNLF